MYPSKLRWQCRRGMRELDELLLKHLENAYPQASDEEKTAFHELLMLSDPQLKAYLMGGEQTGQAAQDRIILQMRN
ncbi:MAG: succinate dehydrogenase assembly factor 2 [Gammaproteobacteria bacterium]|nr:succinate dehydrogenase assembly factor 2 [Gammaproteobacteria bacterium]